MCNDLTILKLGNLYIPCLKPVGLVVKLYPLEPIFYMSLMYDQFNPITRANWPKLHAMEVSFDEARDKLSPKSKALVRNYYLSKLTKELITNGSNKSRICLYK